MNRRYPSRLGLFKLLTAASLGLLAGVNQAADPVRIGIPLARIFHEQKAYPKFQVQSEF